MKILNTEEMHKVAGGYWEGEPQEGGDGEEGSLGKEILQEPIFY